MLADKNKHVCCTMIKMVSCLHKQPALIFLALVACVSLHAKEADSSLIQNSSFIYIGDDAVVYGKEYLVVSPSPHRSQNLQNNKASANRNLTDNKAEAKQENPKEPIEVVTDLPSIPSSSSGLYMSEKPAAAGLQYRPKKQSTPCNAHTHKNAFQSNVNIYFAVCLPVQRQKLSTAAIQCGTLTSFSAQSPPESVPSGTRYW